MLFQRTKIDIHPLDHSLKVIVRQNIPLNACLLPKSNIDLNSNVLLCIVGSCYFCLISCQLAIFEHYCNPHLILNGQTQSNTIALQHV
jgi:hypothetical protein